MLNLWCKKYDDALYMFNIWYLLSCACASKGFSYDAFGLNVCLTYRTHINIDKMYHNPLYMYNVECIIYHVNVQYEFINSMIHCTWCVVLTTMMHCIWTTANILEHCSLSWVTGLYFYAFIVCLLFLKCECFRRIRQWGEKSQGFFFTLIFVWNVM